MNSVPVPGRSPCLTCKAFTTIPPPSTPRTPDVALARYPSAHRAISRLRHCLAGSPVRQAESSSLSCGLVVHLLLLPTPPRGDAVTVDYRPESVCLKGTSTPPTSHAHRRTRRTLKGAVPDHYQYMFSRIVLRYVLPGFNDQFLSAETLLDSFPVLDSSAFVMAAVTNSRNNG